MVLVVESYGRTLYNLKKEQCQRPSASSLQSANNNNNNNVAQWMIDDQLGQTRDGVTASRVSSGCLYKNPKFKNDPPL